VALGLVDLYETTFETRWLRLAEQLVDGMKARFEDPVAGGFFSTEAGQGDLLLRQKPGFDHSLPSGNALAAMALLRIGHHLERKDLRASAEGILRCFAPVLEKAPRACLGLLEALDLLRQGPLEIVLAGPRQDPRMDTFLHWIWERPLVHRMLAQVDGEQAAPPHQDKRALDGRPTVYVCRDRTCLDPVTSLEGLERLLPARQF